MSSSDVEASEYDLGTTSVRLIRVGNIVQILFSNKLEAKFFYDETATRFKRAEREFRGG
ncbi:MAG: hypothetical protein HY619_07815 [Thaumarchaeota archaeon]|nr:hypothetical protein [Nitrososphaerota archaeon]